MIEIEHLWKGSDKLGITGRSWRPETEAKAVICLIHGMGEHVGRYEHVAEFFVNNGIAVMGLDQRGHGKSEGKRGHVSSYEVLLDQIDLLLAEAEAAFPNLPKIVYGHSMGGNLVINHSLRRPDTSTVAYIVTSPWLELAFTPPKLQMQMGKMVRSILPGLVQDSKLDPKLVARDEAVVKAYADDPLVHSKISIKFYFAIHESGIWAIENASKLTKPMLLMHAGDDQVTSADASQRFAGRAGSKVKFKKWKDFYHEIHNDPEKQDVFDEMLAWIKSTVLLEKQSV